MNSNERTNKKSRFSEAHTLRWLIDKKGRFNYLVDIGAQGTDRLFVVGTPPVVFVAGL